MSTQATKPPNPFDPVEEERPSDSKDTVAEALESLRRLYDGEPAPGVIVHTDGYHGSASWEKPKK